MNPSQRNPEVLITPVEVSQPEQTKPQDQAEVPNSSTPVVNGEVAPAVAKTEAQDISVPVVPSNPADVLTQTGSLTQAQKEAKVGPAANRTIDDFKDALDLANEIGEIQTD